MGNYDNRRFVDKEVLERFFSEDAEIMDYLDEFKQMCNHNTYQQIFAIFQKKDMRSLAKMMMDLFRDHKDINRRYNETKSLLDNCSNQVKKLEDENRALKDRLTQIKSGKADKNSCENLRILILYEEKYSLREIARRVGRDKSTVKRRLIQMGVIKE